MSRLGKKPLVKTGRLSIEPTDLSERRAWRDETAAEAAVLATVPEAVAASTTDTLPATSLRRSPWQPPTRPLPTDVAAASSAIAGVGGLAAFFAQPDATFDAAFDRLSKGTRSLLLLAIDVLRHGVQQRVVVRTLPDGGHEILSGHRRTAACRLANVPVPVEILQVTDDEAIQIVARTNANREDMTPWEWAVLTATTRATLPGSATEQIAELGRLIGKKRTQVHDYLRAATELQQAWPQWVPPHLHDAPSAVDTALNRLGQRQMNALAAASVEDGERARLAERYLQWTPVTPTARGLADAPVIPPIRIAPRRRGGFTLECSVDIESSDDRAALEMVVDRLQAYVQRAEARLATLQGRRRPGRQSSD